MNKAFLLGNVGQDPEMRYTADGKPVTSFTLAVRNRWSRDDPPTWFKITCWGKLAEQVNEHVSKGGRVLVEGRVGLDEWEGRDGTTRAQLTITADEVQFLSPSQKQAPQEPYRGSQEQDDDEEAPPW